MIEWIDKFMDFYKIGSGDLTAYPVLDEIAKRRKPILLSTGLSNLKEIKNTINYLNKIDSIQYTSSLIDDATYNSGTSLGNRNEVFAAFYVQDEMQLIKDRLILNTSVRFNYDEVYSNFQNGLRWGEQYSPRVSLVYISKNKRMFL